MYERKACEGQQRHGYDEDVRLTHDLQQQDTLERWVEYQMYHFSSLDRMEEKRDKEVKRLAEPGSAEEAAIISISAETLRRTWRGI